MINANHDTPFSKFIWFIGVVEDIVDPEKIGRIKARAIGFHAEDRSAVPHDALPWATMLNSTCAMGAPLVLPGDWVIGFFLDGKEAQQPVILGSMFGQPEAKDKEVGFNDPSGTYPRRTGVGTNSPLARGETDEFVPHQWKKDNLAPDEPESVYAPEYPQNHVIHTDMDNIIELDDTPGKERVHIFHRSGSFYEFHPDGKVVIRSVSDMYEAVFKNKTLYVAGDLKIMTAGTTTINTTGTTNISSGGDLSLTTGGNMKLSAGGNIHIACGGEFAAGTGADINLQAGGDAYLNGDNKIMFAVGSNSAGSPASAASVEKKTVEAWKKPGEEADSKEPAK